MACSMSRALCSARCAPSASPSPSAADDPLERAPELGEHGLHGAADDQRGVGREEERGHAEGDAAADERLGEADGGEAGADGDRRRVHRREQEQRGDRRLGDEQGAAAEDDGGRHREHDHEAHLERAAADRAHDDVGDRQADDDAADQLGRAGAALAVGRADRDDRRDRGERRARVGQQQQRDVPGEHRRRGGVRDRQEPRAEPVDAEREHVAPAAPGARGERSREDAHS